MADHGPENGAERASENRVRSTPDRRAAIDDLLSALAHRRRRDVLYYLSKRESASVEAVSEAIADRETAGDDPDDRLEAIRTDLSHNHLPKLAGRGVIDYDRRSGTVASTTPDETVETLLSCCRDLERDDVSR